MSVWSDEVGDALYAQANYAKVKLLTTFKVQLGSVKTIKNINSLKY